MLPRTTALRRLEIEQPFCNSGKYGNRIAWGLASSSVTFLLTLLFANDKVLAMFAIVQCTLREVWLLSMIVEVIFWFLCIHDFKQARGYETGRGTTSMKLIFHAVLGHRSQYVTLCWSRMRFE